MIIIVLVRAKMKRSVIFKNTAWPNFFIISIVKKYDGPEGSYFSAIFLGKKLPLSWFFVFYVFWSRL